MQGQILEASAAKSGMILGDDGNRYTFTGLDWRTTDSPAAGIRVDFVPGEGGAAREIFPLPGSMGTSVPPPPPPPGSPVVAPQASQTAYPPRTPPNNSQVLGWIGVVCAIVGLVFPIIIPTIAGLILGLIGADTAKKYGDGTGLVVSRIAWIGSLVTFAIWILLLLFAFALVWPILALFIQAAMDSDSSGQGTNALIAFLTR